MWKTIGQQHSINLLEKALKANSIAHAYLLLGTEHIGKNTLAYDFAMAINCQGENVPCGQCISCQRILRNNHADIIYISPGSALDKNSSEQTHKKEIGIEDIRKLQQLASLPPYEGKYKVFIIDGADFLSNEAANCILKTLEEPSPRIVMILLAVDKKNVLPTIISRCQQIQFKPLTAATIEDFLLKQPKVDYKKARLVARLSRGCLGIAISAMEDENFSLYRDTTINELVSLIYSNPDERFSFVGNLDKGNRYTDQKRIIEQLLNTWILWWQDILLIKSNCSENITNLDKIDILHKCSQIFNLEEINHAVNSIEKSLSLISKNANIRLVLEVLMFNMPFKPELKTLLKQENICQK